MTALSHLLQGEDAQHPIRDKLDLLRILRGMMPAVTLTDVAKRAGVSIKTASRVINNEDRVADATRQKVLAAVESLGYVPNVWAQRLARGYSGLVGLVIGDATPSYLMDVLHGLMDVGDAAGFRVSMYRMNIKNPQEIAQIIGMAAQQRVEGFVFTPPCDNSPELIRALQELNYPFVQLTPHERCETCAWVAANDEQGAYEAAWHLLRLGHKRIGVIQGNPGHIASWDRLNGYKRALAEANIPLNNTLIKQGDWSFESGLKWGRELLSGENIPTAIMAGNDDMAAGILQAAWEREWRCPRQLSIVGFDDVPLAKQLSPPLTTVKQPIYDIASTAMRVLIEQIIPGSASVRTFIEVPTQLIIRYSTAAPPVDVS